MPKNVKANASANISQMTNTIKNLSSKLDKLSTNPTVSNKKKRKRRNRKIVGVSSEPYATNTYSFAPRNDMILSRGADTGLRRLRTIPRMPGLTDQGVAFLKCAFAPPDFQSTSLGGCPDDYRGMSLTRKHRLVAPLSLTSTLDYYILILPTPGVAYWVLTTATGVSPVAASVWTGVNYTDFAGMFGTGPTTVANQVSKFRFVSNHIEIIPTVNQMTWSGNIQSWKLPITVGPRAGPNPSTDLITVEGLSGVNTSLANQYSAPFIMGLYSGCYGSNTVFDFQSIMEGMVSVPYAGTPSPGDFGVLTAPVATPGFDNGFESLLVKISGMSANQTALIKTWACVEYQVNPSSTLYEFSSLSPCDPMALSLYKEIILGLPVAVPFEDNENFWNRVLNIINQISGAGAFLPGPYGMASRGINLLSSAGLSLMR